MADTIQETGAEEKKNIVGGFEFASKEDAALGTQELKKVLYLKRHLDYHSTDTVLQMYRKAIQERTFQTPIGFHFILEMRERLLQNGVAENELMPIPVYYDITPPQVKSSFHSVKKQKIPAQERKKEKINRYKISILLNILLCVLVIGMVIIAMTGNNPNILNYKRAVLDEYAAWEQELTERESAVREKERELGWE